jgi:hypothetical protein
VELSELGHEVERAEISEELIGIIVKGVYVLTGVSDDKAVAETTGLGVDKKEVEKEPDPTREGQT